MSLGAATRINSGTITGGEGDFGRSIAGLGGDAVTVATGGTITNTGILLGGMGGGSNYTAAMAAPACT